MKYAKLFIIGFFCLIYGIASAHSLVYESEMINVSRDSIRIHAIIISDSTSSKKKPKNLNEKDASKAKVDYSIGVFYLTTLRKDVSEAARREKGNSVSTNSFVINDQFETSTLSNILSYNIYDNALNVHSFSGTQSTMHPLNFTFENTVNTKVDLYGFEYRFKRNETKKFGYIARARFERDNENNLFYQFGIGANFKREKGINLIDLEHFPVRSGPGHILKIYRTQLSNYNEFQLTNKVKNLFTLEGSYYSDQNADFIAVSRTEYLISESNTFKLSPLIEGAYGLGTIDRRDGYPYWMADKRIYGGGGLAIGIGSKTSAFQMTADASIFGELGQASFERYTGNLSYRIKNFSTVNAGFEMYTIENFYSNVFQFGMVYNFK